MINRRQALILPTAVLLAAASGALGNPTTAAPDDRTIADAYVYLIGRALVIRQEHIDRTGDAFAYNTIKYNPLGSADFVNPNFDVAYLEAWVAVDERTPVLLEVPEITGRYYTAQILDEWAEVIVNINERNFPSKPFGKFALVHPNYAGDIPVDAARIVLHSNKAKLVGRVELKGDPDGALALQKAFKLTALGTPVIAPPSFVPAFGNKDLLGAEIFDHTETILDGAMDVSPVAAALQQQARAVAAHVASSEVARSAVDRLLREKVVPEFQDYVFTKASIYRNHWLIGNVGGTYGADYWTRSSANYAGIWANTPQEVVYLVATRDADEQLLDGSNGYVIHFDAGSLPSSVVDGYWSVILVGVPDYRVVANDLKRYNFNSYSDLKFEPDGSLKIAIGSKPVSGVPESNWLPAPAGKPFSLTFRAYVPKDVVRTGGWTPGPVTKIQ